MGGRPWKLTDIRGAASLLEQRWTVAQVAAHFRRTPASVKQALRTQGYSSQELLKRGRLPTEREAGLWTGRVLDGWTYLEIAREAKARVEKVQRAVTAYAAKLEIRLPSRERRSGLQRHHWTKLRLQGYSYAAIGARVGQPSGHVHSVVKAYARRKGIVLPKGRGLSRRSMKWVFLAQEGVSDRQIVEQEKARLSNVRAVLRRYAAFVKANRPKKKPLVELLGEEHT